MNLDDMPPHTDGPGIPVRLAPGLVRVLAPNPSPMTYRGTNSYLLGETALCIIDPGPDDAAHLDAILAAVAGRPVSHIVVTHSHLDHSALAPRLAELTGASLVGFGGSMTGRSAAMQALVQAGLTAGGEGVDNNFTPDIRVTDGAVIAGADWSVRVIHTPGHFGNHICLRWGDAIFSGDHVMGWASSMVSPPDGDLTDFRTSCHKLRAENASVLYPGHGDAVTDPAGRIDWLVAHRAAREAQVLAQLAQGPNSVAGLTAAIYTDTSPALHPAAARNVLAHLIDLMGRNLIGSDPDLSPDAHFWRL